MPPLFTIARITVLEASRRRLLVALAVLTVVVIGVSTWGFAKIPDINNGQPVSPTEVKTVASQLLILVMFMFSAVLALSAVLVAAPAISSDTESGVTLALLARPLRRSELLLGKALGLAALIVIYAAVAVALEVGGVYLVIGYAPPHPLALIAFLAGEGIVLLIVSLALSTRLPAMTGGVIALGSFFAAWLGGVVGNIGIAFDNRAIENVGAVTRLLMPSDGLWRGAIWSLEPSAVIAAMSAAGRGSSSFPFFASSPPPWAYIAWCLAWAGTVLGLALWSFRNREI